MNTVAIIQARMGSTRLPGKVLKPVAGHPMLWHIVQRLRWVQSMDEVVVATSDLDGDDPIQAFCKENQITCFRGSENDVLDRFYQAAMLFKGDPLIRITGDCPFVDPLIVERVIKKYELGGYDHIGVATGAGAMFEGSRFPDGLDAECFGFDALQRAWQEATAPLDREHVTAYIWRHKNMFRCGLLPSDRDFSNLRWTVDEEIDYLMVAQVYKALYREDRPFLMDDILSYLADHPEVAAINRNFIGQEDYLKVWGKSAKSQQLREVDYIEGTGALSKG